MSPIILVINGPNLNMLGIREPEKYGKKTLEQIIDKAKEIAKSQNFTIKSFQSNHEGELVDYIQREGLNADGIVINAGAYTHTSIAIRDALLSVQAKFVEVHLSNVFSREPFRFHSFLSDKAIGVITGFGENSYYLGIEALIDLISKRE